MVLKYGVFNFCEIPESEIPSCGNILMAGVFPEGTA